MNEVKTKPLSMTGISPVHKTLYYEDAMSPAACRIKRCLDIAGSVIGLVISSPLFLIIYLAIKYEDHGPAIFRQERIGYRGKIFTLYKFRSMKVAAEANGKPALCQKDDKRLTRTGRFLREHHLAAVERAQGRDEFRRPASGTQLLRKADHVHQSGLPVAISVETGTVFPGHTL